ncbi:MULTISPECIES: hypothetical protein [Paenibacillus]|uniref:hypothetical protein n=1 Tax=Paenibacillus TaxID=44249 RepID=UPI0022B93D79|nr:hypothetical protein [Paenibacillus caseinilyticus]
MVQRSAARPVLFLVLAALILLVDGTLSRLPDTSSEDRLLAYAVLFDLMLAVPLLYWLLVARPAGKPVFKVLSLAALGALVAWLVLPAALKATAWRAFWPLELLLIAAEAFVLFYEARLLYRAARRFRELSGEEPDTGERLRRAIRDVLGEGMLSSVLQHDAAMLYYAFFSWKGKRETVQPGAPGWFTYHRSSNQILYAAMLTKILLIETAAVHLLVQQWSSIAAWLLTAADLWLLLLVWADCRAAVLQPVRLDAAGLRLRYGLRIQADLPLHRIDSVTSVQGDELSAEERKTSAMPVVGTPNVCLKLRSPVRVQGLLFLPREVTAVYLALDEPEAFIRQWSRAACRHGDEPA